MKTVVFHCVGISWMLSMKEKYCFSVDENYEEWCTFGTFCNDKIFQSLCGP